MYLDLDNNEEISEPYVRVVAMQKVFDMTYSDGNGEWSMCDGCETGGNAYITDIVDVQEKTFGKKLHGV